MKLPEKLKPSKLFKKDKKGVALVTVLTVMALTTILVMTFFSLATSEHRASNTYSHGLQAQQVAEQAVNMVIAQIREATTVGTKKAWASQPGAIRQWEQNGDEGYAYKLYSDDKLKTKDWGDFQKDFTEVSNWSEKPSHFVDLNEPVIRGEKVYYPIVHPLAATVPQWPQKIGDDPDDNGVEGFSYNETDSIRDFGPVGTLANGIIKQDHVAMPVKWIYQLADGTLGVLDESGGTGSNAAFQFVPISSGGSEASEKNPIAARFAFWADDETTKLNINTHAGGLAWDIPKAGGELDMAMGKYQPAQNEWQRYPGHPASVHLSPALAPGVLDIVNDREAMEMLYKVVPRVVGGGSESGTRIIDTRRKEEQNGLIADFEPLFPTLDDVIMRSDRTPHEFPDAQGQAIPPNELSEYLERSKFFVTVNSRAPETTLFNTPKIAIWPIYNAAYGTPDYDKTKLTTFDRLIHYCASMGKAEGTDYPRYEYIFKREKADSATHDYEIPRNKILYSYLRSMLREPIPGYGDSFEGKYGKENVAQIATMIFDYIRTTNLHDDTLYEDFGQAFTKENSDVHPTYTNPRDSNEPGFGHKGHGQVTPIEIEVEGVDTEASHGIGRFYTLAGAHVHVTCVAQPGLSGALYPGMTQYRRGQVEGPVGELYTNLPPLPAGVTKEVESAHPLWLSALKTSNPNEYNAAFEPANWNWQLAFLDQGYRDAVISNPSANKYNRSLITAANTGTMRLEPNERLVQAAFMFNLFSPSIGWGSINPDMEMEISAPGGMTFASTGNQSNVGFLGFENSAQTYIWATNWAKPHKQGGARSWGGLLSFGYTISARQPLQESGQLVRRNVWWQLNNKKAFGQNATSNGIRSRLTPIDRGYDQIQNMFSGLGRDYAGSVGNSSADVARAYQYDLVTVPFKIIAGSNKDVAFTGGDVNFRIFDKGSHTEGSSPDSPERNLVQDVTIKIDPFEFPAPVISPGWQGHVNEFNGLSHDSANALELASLTAEPANPIASAASKSSMRSGVGSGRGRASASMYGRLSFLAAHWDSGSTYVRPFDIVQSYGISHGDARLAAAKKVIVPGDEIFTKSWKGGPMSHSLVTSSGVAIQGFNTAGNGEKEYLIIPNLTEKPDRPYRNAIPLPFQSLKSSLVQDYGDFDNGAGTMIDGPYINKPDEGNVHSLKTKFTQGINDIWESRRNRGDFPYFSTPDLAEAGGPAYFSPNRIVSGPGMFGSIPTGVTTNDPWQTLLFRPNVEGGRYKAHPGRAGFPDAKSPPDHVIMDMFWMPVVEPYAISEPLSTGGKINLNYQIVPFLHVNRNTALRGVFRSEIMLCVPNTWHASYKHDYGRGKGYHWRDNPYGGALQGKRLRAAIVEHTTLEQFEERFDKGRKMFKSSSEICEIHLVPEEASKRLGRGNKGGIGTYTPTVAQMEDGGKYWEDHSLVGDNSRERPYTNIQTRVTTKSNTYLVHYRAQVLKQTRRDSDSDYGLWRPGVDTVQAEYRGSSMVERYVEPNSEDIIDYAEEFGGNNPIEAIDRFYQFRVVNPKRFAP